MNKSKLSLDSLKSHLFEAIEGVKNLSDPEASDNERLSIEQAKTISGLAGNIIDIYKTQLDAVKTLESLDNVGSPRDMLTGLGVTDEDTIKQIGY